MKSIFKKFNTVFFLSILLLSGCEETNKDLKQQEILQINTMPVKKLNYNLIFSTSGTIEASKSASISTRLMGYIDKINVKIGDKVKKGEILLRINSSDLKAKKGQIKGQIAKAKSYYINAKKDFERFTLLFKNNSASQKELDNITTNYEQAKAGLETALQMQKELDANLAYANIKAPFSGVITGKFISKGDLANPGKPLLRLENTTHFLVKTYLNENQINKIKKGGVVEIHIKSNGKKLQGIISELSISSNNSGSLYLVKIAINESENIFTGMYVSVDFLGNTLNNTLVIPKSALVQKGQLYGVYTVSLQNTAILRWLRLGKVYGNNIEVLSGLNVDENIIINANGKLFNGAKVTLK